MRKCEHELNCVFLFAQQVSKELRDLRIPRLCLFTNKDIAAGSPLVMSYGTNHVLQQ